MENDYKRRVCDRQVICPTSDNEMSEIRTRLSNGDVKMDEIHNGIRKNRKFDIAILTIAVISFFVNLYLNGGK